MLFKTKLFRNVNKIFYTLKRRVLIVQNSFSLALFSLFLGFLCGNLFGTFLDTLRIYFLWNGFVAFIILLFIEVINFFVYKTPLAEKIDTNLSVSNMQNSSSLRSETSPASYARQAPSESTATNSYELLRKPLRGKPLLTPTESKSSPFGLQQKRGIALLLRSSRFLTQLRKPSVYKRSSTSYGGERSSALLAKVQRKGRHVRFTEVSETISTIYIERSLNAFKIGLLFGFFIDSFKVGS